MKMVIQEIFILQGGYNMEEEFYYEESNPKHVFVKCLAILFIIGIVIGLFLYNKNNNVLKLKDIKINLGDKLSTNIEDYIDGGIKYIDDYKLYLDNIDTNKVGEYVYTVKYKKHKETGIIKIVDNKKPEVTLSDNIIIGTKEELDLNMLISKCVDDSLPCNVSLKKDNDLEKLKTEGTYKIDVVVSDAVGNKTNLTVDITTSDTETFSSLQTKDLKYYTNSENDDTIESTLFIALEKAINEETHEYESLIRELSVKDFSEYVSEDKEIYDIKLISAYNKYGYVIGFQVLATFTDGTSELLENKVNLNEEN